MADALMLGSRPRNGSAAALPLCIRDDIDVSLPFLAADVPPLASGQTSTRQLNVCAGGLVRDIASHPFPVVIHVLGTSGHTPRAATGLFPL